MNFNRQKPRDVHLITGRRGHAYVVIKSKRGIYINIVCVRYSGRRMPMRILMHLFMFARIYDPRENE